MPRLLVLAVVILAPTLSASEPLEKVYYDYVDERTGQLGGGIAELPLEPRFDLSVILADVETTLDNGPSSNRIDLVMVGDGYTAEQLAAYAAHAASWQDAFLTTEPFASYSTFFNFHRVNVVSPESGVDHDPTNPTWRDTALNMAFWCSNIERLLCVNVSLAYSYANNAPDVDQVIAIANSSKYGGAGYPSSELATVAGANGSAREIALHELGHSLGNLADEYYSSGTYTGGEPSAPNASRLTEAQMAAAQTKWFRWLGTNDPAYDGLHSTYQGASQYQFGLYRPSNNSRMRSLGRPFNLVSMEALIVEFYRTVRPIDDSTPVTTQLNGSETVFVDPVQPLSHALSVQWSLDGSAIPGATAVTLDLATLKIGPGDHTLSVVVLDPTPYVRNETLRNQWMRQTRAWSLSAPSCSATGDMNCDGVLSVSDIPGFVLALTNPAAYAAAFPGCDMSAADVDCNAHVSVGDIAGFVALLGS